jgi:hypothetical protein
MNGGSANGDAFDYWTKFTGGRNRDIYPPSRRSRACARDPATLPSRLLSRAIKDVFLLNSKSFIAC